MSLAMLAPALAARAHGAASADCPPAPSAGPSREANIFSPQQEMDWGDAVHESIQTQFRVIEATELTAHLTRIGERLLRHLPPSEVRFRFLLSDLPAVEAMTLPGGRVYVTRKMAAFLRSEDELASVLAHELGHGLMHHGAVEFARLLRQVLGVTRVGDRKDVFAKFHQLQENIRREPGAYVTTAKRELDMQMTADRIAIYALGRAGYQPQAFAGWWDRFHETRGKTGNWLSDFFGMTKPEARRLREMLKRQAALPAACVEARPPVTDEPFSAWQAAVIAYSGLAREEVLPGLLWRKSLDPPLQADIQHLRFSPDGRYVLAQDDASIFVFSSDPFAPLFRVEALEAAPAQFSPDSKAVVFHTPHLRVERWDVASGERVAVHEMTPREPCRQTALSPDGRFLACFDLEPRLALMDVEKGDVVFEKKPFLGPGFRSRFEYSLRAWRESWEADWIQMRFSPDGRYFLAGAYDTAPAAFDLAALRTAPLPDVFRDLTQRNFTFVGSNRLAGVDARDARKSALVRFPGGEPVARIELGSHSRLDGAAGGDRLLIRPLGKYPVAAVDPKTQKVLVANTLSAALDFHHDLYVTEVGDGTLDLRRLGERSAERVGRVPLPRSPLGRLRATALTPDLKWLAVSQRRRGAVWNLERGERVLQVRGFRGAYVGSDEVLLADFPGFGETARSIARLSLAGGTLLEAREVEKGVRTVQLGAQLLVTRFENTADGQLKEPMLEALDTRSGARLWSRRFPGGPPSGDVWPDEGTLTLAWSVRDRAAQEAIDSDPALKRRWAAMKEPEGDYLLEVLEARTGRALGRVLVETGRGSFRITGIRATRDWLAIDDSQHRVLVYSLPSGEAHGKVFGGRATLSEQRGLLWVESDPGRAAVYALAGMAKRAEAVFSNPVALARFGLDGRRLFVLTADQTAYVFDAERW